MISVFIWDPDQQCGRTIPVDDFARAKDELRGVAGVVWIDLENPTPQEEDWVLKGFLPLHTLTVEDVTRPRRVPDSPPHFPKVEEFKDYLFVVVNPLAAGYLDRLRQGDTAAPDLARSLTQLSAILSQRVLITHHYHPEKCIKQVRDYLERHQHQAGRGPDFLFHLILDCTVDQFAPVLDHLDDALSEMEERLVHRPRHAHFVRLLRLKRHTILLRKTLIYEREVLVRLSRGDFSLIDEREMVYYRNVYDHLVRFTELIESSREMVSDLMQSYLAAISNRLNEIMKVLTMISTIVLPMTLIAGVYGMNFRSFPELDWAWGYPFALGLMVLTGVVALVLFKWRKWM